MLDVGILLYGGMLDLADQALDDCGLGRCVSCIVSDGTDSMHRQSRLCPEELPRKRVAGGIAATNVILSAQAGENSDMFPSILALHVPPGAEIADVTYGKGVFWRSVDLKKYALYATDLQTGVDCRELPYKDASLDCVVLDPPYMEGLYRRHESHLAGDGSHRAFREHYSNGQSTTGGPKYHDAVLDMYFKAGTEARRVLKDNGVLIVKCQDEVSANRQRLTHVEIVIEYEKEGLYAKDLFVLVRRNRAGVSRLKKQAHARTGVGVRIDAKVTKQLAAAGELPCRDI